MKNILIVFILINSILFAKINDTLSLFSEEQKETINTEIKKIQTNYDVDIYVNTYSADEGFIIDKNQKVIALNIIKIDNDNMKVELKFSKDMELDEEIRSNIENMLMDNKNSIERGKNSQYVQEMLVGVDGLLENIKIETPIVIEGEEIEENKNYLFITLGLAILIIFGIIVRVMILKNRRK